MTTEQGCPTTMWLGWVGEYMTDQGTDHHADPERVTDVGVYLKGCVCEDDPCVTLTEVMTLLEGYNDDAPEVEDTTYLGYGTVTDLMGYLGMRYENYMENG